MRVRRTVRTMAVAATLVLALSGCYEVMATNAKQAGGPVPWFCDPVAPNSVTGPGMGTVDFYAGQPRSPLGYDACIQVGKGLDAAKGYAEQYPTTASAEAAGLRSTFGYITGMGTHHGRGAISPALLADPSFDRRNPIIPNSIIDDVFDPAQPEFLQYSSNGPTGRLVGMSYYVRTTTGRPPAGFPGVNDRWHHHPTLCFDPATAQARGVNTTDAGCAQNGGINVHLDDYYMLHVWLVEDMEYHADVHAPTHPCVSGPGGATFDMGHPCHDAWSGRTARSASRSAAPTGFCAIGQLEGALPEG